MITTKLPSHISFVLDGNRRWAHQAMRSSLDGHLRGMDKAVQIAKWCNAAGVKYLTAYAFSVENWGRPPEELDYLFNAVLNIGLAKYLPEIKADNIQVQVYGDLTKFPEGMRRSVQRLVDETRDNTGLIWNICLNYGGRDELVWAVRHIIRDNVAEGAVNEDLITSYLYSANVPDPDLMIRTGGEQRLSNFLLWQHSYAELYFEPKYLPDFEKEDFEQILEWYAGREQRKGK